MQFVNGPIVFVLSLILASGLPDLVLGIGPMGEFVQATHFNPVILYECYRNGTTYEPGESVNVSAFFDGTQSEPNEMGGYIFYAKEGAPGKVTRKPQLVTYDEDTDTTTTSFEGTKTHVTLLQLYKNNVQHTREVAEDGTITEKIYDIDQACPTAQELYQDICQEDCNLVAARMF